MAATQCLQCKDNWIYLLKIGTCRILLVCYVLVTTPYAGHSFISILLLCGCENATAGMFSYEGAVCTELWDNGSIFSYRTGGRLVAPVTLSFVAPPQHTSTPVHNKCNTSTHCTYNLLLQNCTVLPSFCSNDKEIMSKLDQFRFTCFFLWHKMTHANKPKVVPVMMMAVTKQPTQSWCDCTYHYNVSHQTLVEQSLLSVIEILVQLWALYVVLQVKVWKLGSDKPVGVGVALGAVLLDSITVYSGTTTPNMVTGAVVLISSTASPSVAMIVYDGWAGTLGIHIDDPCIVAWYISCPVVLHLNTM